MINNIKTFITDNQKDLKYLTILAIFLLIITVPKLLMQYNIGIGNWDTYLYLENGRNFAKMGWGDVPSIAPVLPMILSKMFLIAGKTYQESIFNIDATFYIIGILAFYLLLRLKFNENISLIGSVIFATFTLLYSWVAIGGNDIIGVTGTILTVYLIFISHKYNNKFYYLALPMAAYAFLSRYTAGVMIFSILFYLLISKVRLNEIKHIIIGGILGVISVSWFLYQFYIHLGTPFPFLGQFSGTVANTIVMDSGFLPDSWYYIKHLPSYLSSFVPEKSSFTAIVNPMGNIPSLISYVYIALFVLGFVLLVYHIYSKVKTSEIRLENKSIILLFASAILFAIFLFTLGNISYIFSSIIFLIVLYIIWKVLEPYEIKDLDFEFVMISLFVTYLIFQSILFTKNDRYFITVLPFIAYFIIYTVDKIFEKLSSIKHGVNIQKILTALIIIVLLCNSMIFVSQIPKENNFNDIDDACDWLSENRNISGINYYIHSDNWPAVTWYLNLFTQRAVINTSNASQRAGLSEEMLTISEEHMASSYYIDTTSNIKYDYPGLRLIKEIGSVGIYENKYLDYGIEYITTEEYNNTVKREIEEYNRTKGYYV